MKILSSTYELVEIDALTPHPENPRRGDIEAVAESIDQNDFYGAVIAQVSTRRILVGNHRWKAAKKRGALFIPVLWVDCDDDRARRILLVSGVSIRARIPASRRRTTIPGSRSTTPAACGPTRLRNRSGARRSINAGRTRRRTSGAELVVQGF